MSSVNRVLVLGATVGIGGEVARQLRDRGWEVKALRRAAGPPEERQDGITWIRGDAMRAADVSKAATGCSVIVHAVNPPGYRRWGQLVLPMLDNTISAARESGATIVLPGTVYNYDPSASSEVNEESSQQPFTRKGAIRVEMERRLRAASESGARVLIVRAGDFFGPKVGNSWFSQGLIKPGKPVESVTYPGAAGVGHQWSYLPDVAQTMAELLDRRASLEPFAVFHMKGHWDADGSRMVDAIRRVSERRGRRKPRITTFPWVLIALASPLVTTFHEMREMRYLWRMPLRLDGKRLEGVLGREPHTPLDEAVEATLEGLGCF